MKMFKVQQFSETETRAIFDGHSSFDSERHVTSDLSKANHRSQILLQTIIMLGSKCDAKCGICYTRCRKVENPLSSYEIQGILNQTRALGSRLVYIPGEGEPMLDDAIWDTLETAAQLGMAVVLFTNGLLLSNDSAAQRRWGMTSEDIVRRLATLPVYIYHKFWSLDPSRLAVLLGVKGPRSWVDIAGLRHTGRVPRGLALLRDILPSDRVGVQITVSPANFDETVAELIPFAEEFNLPLFIEPVLQTGRAAVCHDTQLTPEQRATLAPWLSRKPACPRLAYSIVVHNNATLSPGIAIRPDTLFTSEADRGRFSLRDENGGIKDIFTMLHTDPFLIWARTQSHRCLCECFAREGASGLLAGFNSGKIRRLPEAAC